MKFWQLILVLAAGPLLQSTWLSQITIWGAKPDLLLLAVVVMALVKGPAAGSLLGFAFGLVEDIILGRYLGLNALSKALTGYLIGLGKSKLFLKNPLVLAGASLVGSLACQLLYVGLVYLAGGRPFFTWRIWWGEGFYNLLFALFFYRFYKRLIQEVEEG